MAVDWVEKNYAGYKYLRPPTLAETKIKGSIPGHELHFLVFNETFGSCNFQCTCGFTLHIYARADGSARTTSQRQWDIHLENAGTSPNERFNVGTVQRQKGPLQTVFIALKEYDTNRSYRRTSSGGTWCIFVEADDAKTIVGGGTTKSAALTKAMKWLDSAQRRGSIVERDNEVLNIPGATSVRGTIAALITAEPKNILEIQEALDAIEEVMLLVPLLENKRSQLGELRDSFLASLLD